MVYEELPRAIGELHRRGPKQKPFKVPLRFGGPLPIAVYTSQISESPGGQPGVLAVGYRVSRSMQSSGTSSFSVKLQGI